MTVLHDLISKIEERRKARRRFTILAFTCSLIIFVLVLLVMSLPSLA